VTTSPRDLGARSGPPDPNAPGAWKVGFGRRLGYYVFGIALGFVILGIFHAAKRHAAVQAGPASSAPAAEGARAK
jgi:hypothetical protein